MVLFIGDFAEAILFLPYYSSSPRSPLRSTLSSSQEFRKLFPLKKKRVNSRRSPQQFHIAATGSAEAGRETLIPFLAWRFRPESWRKGHRRVTEVASTARHLHPRSVQLADQRHSHNAHSSPHRLSRISLSAERAVRTWRWHCHGNPTADWRTRRRAPLI